MGVVEGLICGRDKEVRGAHVRVTTMGRDVQLTRPVQKLYPIDVHAGPNAGKRQDRNRVQPADLQGSSRPRRVAALDAARSIDRRDFFKTCTKKGNDKLLPKRPKNWWSLTSFRREHAPKNTLNLKNRASLADKATVSVSPKILQLDL